MDIQPRYGPQAASNVFADGRAMRMPVAGTISQGRLASDDHYDRGYHTGPDAQTGQPTIAFFEALPAQVSNDADLPERGRTRFNIYCASCHGTSGDGHGPTNERAVTNKEPKWVPALSLLSAQVRELPDGHLYNVIRNGIRSMPAHGSQIGTHDRWAIVAHVRQLQHQSPEAPASQPSTADSASPQPDRETRP
jgi:mono/diheme cytochrome c family protein